MVTGADEFAPYRALLDPARPEERRRILLGLCERYGVATPPPALLSTAAAADMIGVGVDTLEKWRSAQCGPPWIRIDRLRYGRGPRDALRAIPRYRLADVTAWLESQRVTPTPTVPRRRGRR